MTSSDILTAIFKEFQRVNSETGFLPEHSIKIVDNSIVPGVVIQASTHVENQHLDDRIQSHYKDMVFVINPEFFELQGVEVAGSMLGAITGVINERWAATML